MQQQPSGQHSRTSALAGSAAAPVAFISYAHTDSEIVLAFRDALAAHGLNTIIDVDDLHPGGDITEFARRSVKAADATICVVSLASLSSAWVVFEAVTALQKEHTGSSGRLIACAIDDAFFDREIRISITQSLDQRLAEIKDLLHEYLAKEIDLTDLSLERSQLLKMRNALGDVLARLRNSLTLTLKRDHLAETAARVAAYIRELRGQPPSTTDPRDIGARADELRSYLWDGQTDDALDRLLDFVREFSDLPKHLNEAISIANTLRRIGRFERESGLSFSTAEEQRQPAIRRLLELIDDIEISPQLPVLN